MTIETVAGALNISKATVSRAITGNGRISPETRRRVLEYMEEQNYRPNLIAQNLANLRTENIAFAVPSQQEFSETPFFLQCLIGLERAAKAAAYDVLIVDHDDMAQIRRVVERRKVDGVILSRSIDNDQMVDYLIRAKVPFVIIGSLESDAVCQVDHDHFEACRELTLSLLNRWEGKFGLLIGEQAHVVNQNRCRGFLLAAGERGLVRWGVSNRKEAARAAEELYTAGARALFCADDIIFACLPRKWQYGEVHIASFYGGRALDNFGTSIPFVKYDAKALGAKAGKLLIRKLKGEELPQRTLVGYKVSL